VSRFTKLFSIAVALMSGVLKPLGEDLFILPSGLNTTRTAGPPFQIVSEPGYLPIVDVTNQVFDSKIAHILSDAKHLNAGGRIVIRESVLGVLESILKQLETGICGHSVNPLEGLIIVPIKNSESRDSRLVFISKNNATALTLSDNQTVEVVDHTGKHTIPLVLFVDSSLDDTTVKLDTNALTNLKIVEPVNAKVYVNYVIQSEILVIDTVNLTVLEIDGGIGQLLNIESPSFKALKDWLSNRPLRTGLVFDGTLKLHDGPINFKIYVASINLPAAKIGVFKDTSNIFFIPV